MKRAIALAVVVGMSCLAETTNAAVVLEGSAPTSATNIFSSYPASAPLVVTDSSDYFTLGTFRNNDPTAAGTRPTGSSFGAALVPFPESTVRLAASNQGPAVSVGNFKQGWVFNNGETFNATNGATDGISLTYTLAANTTAKLDFLIGSINAVYEYSLTATGESNPIASLATPTGMTGGSSTIDGQPGSGNNNGILSFTVANQNATPTTLTFKLLYAGPSATGAANPGVGIQAATAVVPEPAAMGLLGVGTVTFLRRRRREVRP